MSKYDELLHQMESTVETADATERAKMADKAVLMARQLRGSNPELAERFTQVAIKARKLRTKWGPPLPPGAGKQFAG